MDDKEVFRSLRTAIKHGNVEDVIALISSDTTRLETMTLFGTWLHVAASFGQLEIVKRLIAMGADVNRKGGVSEGGPLDPASAGGHIEVVKYLLSCGAEMDVSRSESNPLFSAIYGGHTDVARLLIESGIDTKVKYTGSFMESMDALAFANEWGRTDIADLLKSSSK